MLPHARQLEVKQSQVDEALRRIGRLDGFELEPIVPAEQEWRYRNKLEYSFGTADDGGLVCGFHAPGSWERIVPLTDCLLASERGNAAREAVVAWCRDRGLRAWDRRTHEGLLRNVVVREGRRTGELQVRLVTSDAPLDPTGLAEAVGADSLVWTRAPGVAETTAGGVDAVLHGTEAIEEEVAGLRFRISTDAFFQTNTEMAERLYGVAARVRGPPGLGARLRPLLRDRHDRPDHGRARRRGLGPGDRRGGGRRRHRQRPAQRGRQRAASSPATSAPRCATSSRRRAAPTSWSSTRRARA